MKLHVGSDILGKFVENTPGYCMENNTEKQNEMKEEAYEHWMAYLMMHYSD
jgi:hypothetical protein